MSTCPSGGRGSGLRCSSSGTHNTTPVTTWPTAGITNNNTGGLAQTATVYADVQRIRYTATDVYINSNGLASYTMGPFLTNNGGLFGFWPVQQSYSIRLTRTPSVPAAKTAHGTRLPLSRCELCYVAMIR